MQGEESHGFAETMLHLGRILTPSFWTLPSSLSPVQGSWNILASKQAPLGPSR